MECVTGHTIKDCIPNSENGPLPSLDLMGFVSNECGALPLSSCLSPGSGRDPGEREASGSFARGVGVVRGWFRGHRGWTCLLGFQMPPEMSRDCEGTSGGTLLLLGEFNPKQ